MIPKQTNLSVSTGIVHRLYQSTNTVINKKDRLNDSVNTEIVQFGFQIRTKTKQSLGDQNALFHFNQLGKEEKSLLLYNDTPISKLSVDEANALISDGGYFSVDKTSRRIVDFVIKGAGDDIDRLRAGREGVLRGFAEAEKAWGGKLPDISYDTLSKSLEVIDKKIRESGGSVVDLAT